MKDVPFGQTGHATPLQALVYVKIRIECLVQEVHPVGVTHPTRGVWVKHKNALPDFGTHLDRLGAHARFRICLRWPPLILDPAYRSQGPAIKELCQSMCSEDQRPVPRGGQAPAHSHSASAR